MNIIGNYSYNDKPYDTNKKFDIFTLDDKGIKKYIFSKDSHLYSFIPMKNSNLIKLILNNNKENNIIQSRNKKQSKNNSTEKEISETIRNKIIRNEKIDNEINKNNSEKELFKNKLKRNEVIKIQKKKGMNELRKNMSVDKMNEYNSNSKNIPLLYKPNKYFQSFHRNMSFEDIFGYKQPLRKKYSSDIYNISLSYLKNNLENNSNINSKINIIQNSLTPKLKKNITKSTSCLFKGRLNLSLGIDNSFPQKEKDKIIQEKNINLKKILLNQTNETFLNKYKLPDIRKIADSQKLISKINNQNPKFFGVKYNPNAFLLNLKTIRGRNYVGNPFPPSD